MTNLWNSSSYSLSSPVPLAPQHQKSKMVKPCSLNNLMPKPPPPTPEENEAYSNGYEDAFDGKTDLANPYDFDTQNNLFCAWIDGYHSFEDSAND